MSGDVSCDGKGMLKHNRRVQKVMVYMGLVKHKVQLKVSDTEPSTLDTKLIPAKLHFE